MVANTINVSVSLFIMLPRPTLTYIHTAKPNAGKSCLKIKVNGNSDIKVFIIL